MTPHHATSPHQPEEDPPAQLSLSHRLGMSRGGAGTAVRDDRGRSREGVGPLLVEMCILHSRTTVGTALSSAKCTSRRPGASAAASARLAAPLPGARGGAGCPNLLQRLGSSRGPRGESLIFRASSRRRSRRGAPLRRIWTRPAPGMPQEPHLHRPAPAHPPHRADPGPRATAPDEKGSHSRPRRRAAPEVTAGAPFWRRPRLYPRSRRRR